MTFRFAALCLLAPCAFAQRDPPIDPSLDISIVSSKDGSKQPVIFYMPAGSAATASGPKVPLVVFLHSWSTDYKTVGLALEETKHRNWVFAGPNGAAARLGIKRPTLQFRMQKLGISRPQRA